MAKVVEGSVAIAEAVTLCRPNVIAAYPITPQTHIVETLSKIVADGKLQTELINAESEHSAASICLGASATGARSFTASTSQGLLLMNEVLYNIAGLRLPIVLTGVNRAISAPLNIWNDTQDTFSVRDSGWIQLYAQDNQEAVDLHIQAFKIAEDRRILLPVMICVDGFLLTHTYESVEIPAQEEVDKFLPKYEPLYYLTPKNPLTFGAFCEPDKYMEVRYMMEEAMENAKVVIQEVADKFKDAFGRFSGDLVEKYQIDDAEIVLISLGSLTGTLKDLVDELRAQNQKIGLLRIRAHRPFPKEILLESLQNAKKIAVFEKAISLGLGGILYSEVKSVFYGQTKAPEISGFIVGLGGRDVPTESIKKVIEGMETTTYENYFVDLNRDLF